MIQAFIEEHVPITDIPVQDYDTLRKRAALACQTARLLQHEGEEPEPPANALDMRVIMQREAKAMAPYEPSPEEEQALTSTNNAIYLQKLLSAYDMQVVQDAMSLRRYITNRLIIESDHKDVRIRMKALEMMGKITDVGLFTERSEVTVNNRTTSDLKQVLAEKLQRLSQVATQVEDAVPVRRLDIAKELGADVETDD